jgi:hypothetical protein
MKNSCYFVQNMFFLANIGFIERVCSSFAFNCSENTVVQKDYWKEFEL